MARSRQRGRPERPPAPPEERRASPRVLAIAGIVAVLLIGLGVTLGVVLGDDSSGTAGSTQTDTDTTATSGTTTSETATGPTGTLPEAAEVERLFADIPQRANALGSPSASVTMIEYLDLQCPFCQQFATEALPRLIDEYVRTGKLRVEVRPLGSLGFDSQRGRLAIIAAGRQNKLFELAHLLFVKQGVENSGWLSDEFVETAAASIDGLDVDRFDTDFRSPEVEQQASAYDAASQADNVEVTPTILVGKTGGKLRPVTLAAAVDPEPVVNAVEAALG